jgi:protein transport protein SEC13
MENKITFPSFHNGSVNSIKLNYQGDKIATCGNDYKINIFSLDKIKSSFDKQPISELTNNGHEQSIWDLSFSHPSLGNYIASCGYDNKLIIWKENKSHPNIYENIYTKIHSSSVNCCKFAPKEYGLIILCGLSDGSISLHQFNPNSNSWIFNIIERVHKNGINSVDWAPALPPITFDDVDDDENENENNNIFSELNPMRFVTCGNDNKIHIYVSNDNNNINSFVEEFFEKEINYESAPKSVSFLNYVGYSFLTFAAGFEDGKCIIFRYDYDNKLWMIKDEIDVISHIIKVNWSECGTYLGISCKNENYDDSNNGEAIVFFKQNLDEKWIKCDINEFKK